MRMRSLAVAAVAVLAATGCKAKQSKPVAPPADADAAPSSADAAAAAPAPDVPLPDEDTLRAGKRTGLGGPDEQPEVATEDFTRAVVAGTTPWSRVVAPGNGVVELRHVGAVHTITRRCGPAVDAALATLAAEITAALAHPELYDLSCDNTALAGAEPRSALCSVESAASGELAYDLIFVPDPTLGLRLAGVSAVESGAPSDDELDAFDLELARASARCP